MSSLDKLYRDNFVGDGNLVDSVSANYKMHIYYTEVINSTGDERLYDIKISGDTSKLECLAYGMFEKTDCVPLFAIPKNIEK